MRAKGTHKVYTFIVIISITYYVEHCTHIK